MKRAIILLIFSCLAMSISLFAQNINLKDFPSLDPQVRSGVLPNGMKYFIRSNALPEKRGEFYIVTNVGAIQEDDDQNGLAHFSEHMAFNGTRNFPKKGILNYLETIGVKFGQNVNASTGVEQTMYNMSNVPLTREGIIDSALLVLFDWASNISFEPEEIDLERGVIMEEWRMYGSANERMNNKLRPVMYKNSKYAKRDIIGDTSVIRHFEYETIRRFYKKWYRPDLQAVVVVGDFDEALMENKIIKLFSTIPKVDNPSKKEIFPVPDNAEPLVGIASDVEATESSIDVIFKHNNIPETDKNFGYMRLQIVRSFINSMLGQRLNELTRTENPPFLRAYSYYGELTRTKDAFFGSASAANNKAPEALKALLIEMERMVQFGFTDGEFERAKANILRSNESRFLERNKRKNREMVYPVISYFLRSNPNPGIEFENKFVKDIISGISLSEVNTEARKYVRNDNMIVTVTGPEKEGVTLPDEREIKDIIKRCKSEKIEAYADKLAGKKLMEKMPVSGKIEKKVVNSDFGTTEFLLSNGMKVVVKSTEFKEDELSVTGFSEGGLSKIGNADLPSAKLLGSAVYEMGVSDYSRSDLVKLLAGKKANLSLRLGKDQESISARTSPKDLETALQLIHLQFTKPRWSESDFKVWMDKVKADYINSDAEPREAFSDTITIMMANHHPRVVPMDYTILSQVNLDRMKNVFADRFADPSSFTFIFTGKVNIDELKPLIEKYLASLSGVKRSEKYVDDGVRPPKGKATNDFKRENTTPRTSVYVCYNGKCGFSLSDRIMAQTLKHCLELRYTQAIREDEGGAYSIRVSYNVFMNPEPGYMLSVIFDTDPAKTDKLVQIVHDQVNNIVKDGPREEDLQKAKEFFLKQKDELLKENSWWEGILSDYYFYGINGMKGYEEMVKALTVKQVKDYAAINLSTGNYVEVIMRP